MLLKSDMMGVSAENFVALAWKLEVLRAIEVNRLAVLVVIDGAGAVAKVVEVGDRVEIVLSWSFL